MARHRWFRSWVADSAPRRKSSMQTVRRSLRGLEQLEGRDVPSTTWRFDFGTKGSPVAPGYLAVAGADPGYSPNQGYGWQNGDISYTDWKRWADPLTRDAAVTADGTFAVDVAAGTYNVTVTLGDPRVVRDQVQVFLAGIQVGTVTTQAGQFTRLTNTVTIPAGPLTLRLVDQGGQTIGAAIQGLDIVPVLGASFTNGGPVAEGGAGAVSFSDVSGGTGGYTYSYDFDNDGVFEVANSSQASVAVPPQYLADGPAARVVRGRVTAGDGSYSDQTTAVMVNNVPPVIGSAASGQTATPGVPTTFFGSVTDAGVNDGPWAVTVNWGDGTTSMYTTPVRGVQSATHMYVLAGTFLVTIMVIDKDGGAASAGTQVTVGNPAPAGVPNQPLLHQANLQYVGAFRVPPFYNGVDEMSYGGTSIAFNPANQSLFIVGHNQTVEEISIPQSIVNSTNLGDLSTSSVLQPWTPILSRLPNNPLGGARIGGLAVVDGKLVGTAYIYYDALGSATVSHFTVDSLNLATAPVRGLYQVGTQGAGYVAGYMTAVPAEWRGALGAPYLTGQGSIPIWNRTSAGPALFGFDPSTLGTGSTPTTPYVNYPLSTPLGPYQDVVDPLHNSTTSIGGAVFVPGSNSVLVFGSTGTNYIGYGEAADFGDTVLNNKGPHSLNGEYSLQVWAYNAADFLSVKQGTLQPHQVVPYDVWNFTVPHPGPSIGGVAFDAASGRLYVSVYGSDRAIPYSMLPTVHVYQVNTQAVTNTAPHIGTLAATPATHAPGPIPRGTAVMLTAGNVYDVNGNGHASQVAFYLDANGNGLLERGVDSLLGYGTPSTVRNGNHNWTLTISTTGMTAGQYTVFAEARDVDQLASNPVAMRLSIRN